MGTTIGIARREAEATARKHAGWIVKLARAGYAAKGAIYLVIGVLALRAAIGMGGGTTDSRGALQIIGGGGLGRGLLLAMGIGLVGYALWAVLSGILDAEDRGSEPRGIALRIGQAFRGLAYGALGVSALQLLSSGNRSQGGDGAEHWSARVLALPWGRALLGIAGAAIIVYALYQLYRGAQKDIQKRLRLGSDAEVRAWVVKLARFGIIARGVVFLIIGWFVLQAAWQYDPTEAGGIQESLAAIGAQPYGRILLGVIALGLMGYGVWQFANARYRRMEVG